MRSLGVTDQSRLYDLAAPAEGSSSSCCSLQSVNGALVVAAWATSHWMLHRSAEPEQQKQIAGGVGILNSIYVPIPFLHRSDTVVHYIRGNWKPMAAMAFNTSS
jgi:hypothetical protein